jgi:hypothetical protein
MDPLLLIARLSLPCEAMVRLSRPQTLQDPGEQSSQSQLSACHCLTSSLSCRQIAFVPSFVRHLISSYACKWMRQTGACQDLRAYQAVELPSFRLGLNHLVATAASPTAGNTRCRSLSSLVYEACLSPNQLQNGCSSFHTTSQRRCRSHWQLAVFRLLPFHGYVVIVVSLRLC